MTQTAKDVLDFWKKAGKEKWFDKDKNFDSEIISRFLETYELAASGGLDHWADDAQSCLALIIVLDQFPRNMFRNDPRAFAADPKALEIAAIARDRNYAPQTDKELQAFLFMPFMHSENLSDQKESVALQTAHGGPENVKAAKWHLEIIERFGRFPHRNPVLGRTMTDEEQVYLDEGGFKG